ncbi:MazG-like family protein [Streptomyces sp. DSM 40750]|uniref:MazG-like family protein n=1 Tax=Streptomyces sp. DSM 40750 TaxID=2801030 RepID=UPI00214AD835|nr:MazG-like family protein [Streptomyces sp. DSM 40750]UUU21561.1 MazG-like family protein [Streptomyces sp. DSM 40750]
MSDQPAVPVSAASSDSPDSPDSPDGLWRSVSRLHAWLEADQPYGGQEGLLLRMLKLQEEVGEVAQAVIGATGQNPRKGTSHTWDDVQSELCDVVITALVALRTLTPDARAVFTAHLARVTERSLGSRHG